MKKQFPQIIAIAFIALFAVGCSCTSAAARYREQHPEAPVHGNTGEAKP